MNRIGSLFCVLLILISAAQARTIVFAGREWVVKTGEGGPGPNRWSDSEESVWVDEDGLHLKIRQIDGVWHCAEIFSVKPAPYGMYRFFVSSPVDLLDPNVVASPFLYKSDTQEIDIEFSRWQNQRGNARNAQFVIQPYRNKDNMERFRCDLNGQPSTHQFEWTRGKVAFLSFLGHGEIPEAESRVLRRWTSTSEDIPEEDIGMRIHINIWLVKGEAPTDGKEAELVIKAADLPSQE